MSKLGELAVELAEAEQELERAEEQVERYSKALERSTDFQKASSARVQKARVELLRYTGGESDSED